MINVLQGYSEDKKPNCINIYNDGKHKHESFEATYVSDKFQFQETGYGEDQDEAIKALRNQLGDMSAELTQFLVDTNPVKNIDYDKKSRNYLYGMTMDNLIRYTYYSIIIDFFGIEEDEELRYILSQDAIKNIEDERSKDDNFNGYIEDNSIQFDNRDFMIDYLVNVTYPPFSSYEGCQKEANRIIKVIMDGVAEEVLDKMEKSDEEESK